MPEAFGPHLAVLRRKRAELLESEQNAALFQPYDVTDSSRRMTLHIQVGDLGGPRRQLLLHGEIIDTVHMPLN